MQPSLLPVNSLARPFKSKYFPRQDTCLAIVPQKRVALLQAFGPHRREIGARLFLLTDALCALGSLAFSLRLIDAAAQHIFLAK